VSSEPVNIELPGKFSGRSDAVNIIDGYSVQLNSGSVTLGPWAVLWLSI
jgi:hypothetical protein